MKGPEDPWEAPKARPIAAAAEPDSDPAGLADGSPPKVVAWFGHYCTHMGGVMGAMSLLFIAILYHEEKQIYNMSNHQKLSCYILAGAGILAIGLFFAGNLMVDLLSPRRWFWKYGIALIGLPIVVCPVLPLAWKLHPGTVVLMEMFFGPAFLASIPLLVYWLKPETRAFFGRSDK